MYGTRGGTCGPDSDDVALVSALLRDNMDYLVDSVCQRLPLLDVYPGTVGVVDCIARCSEVQSVTLMRVRGDVPWRFSVECLPAWVAASSFFVRRLRVRVTCVMCAC